MAIESNAGGISITGAESVRLYQITAITHALALEIVTGMKASRSGSPLKVAKQLGLTNKNTKKGALKDVVAFLTANVEGYTPTKSVQRALDS